MENLAGSDRFPAARATISIVFAAAAPGAPGLVASLARQATFVPLFGDHALVLLSDQTAYAARVADGGWFAC
jgi:hypothetical protein